MVLCSNTARSVNAAELSFQVFLCCNLVTVRFGMLVEAKQLVGKTWFLH